MPSGQKHLIACKCFLPQFKKLSSPPPHQFIVFSILNDNGDVRQKYAQCNNCGIIHRVIDICKSELVEKEHLASIRSQEDIMSGLPEKLRNIIEINDIDYPSLEQIEFVLENQLWGDIITLNSETVDGDKLKKVLKILGPDFFKVETVITGKL